MVKIAKLLDPETWNMILRAMSVSQWSENESKNDFIIMIVFALVQMHP